MMNESIEDGWEDVAGAAAKMFNVWMDGSEVKWAEEAWRHLYAAGLANRESVLDETAAKLRLVTLAQIYQEFCGLAWDENPETPLDYLAEDLEIDPLALGILAAASDADEFGDAGDEFELREAALVAVTHGQRSEIFECLKAAYGGDVQLYTRLWHTRSANAEEDSEGNEFEVTGSNGVALNYVMNGFQEG